jgi:hypothetical protein
MATIRQKANENGQRRVTIKNMKRWRSVKMMLLAMVALFLPAYALPAFCCASLASPDASATHQMMECCQKHVAPETPAALECASPPTQSRERAAHSQPARRDVNLPVARDLSAQLENNRAAFGPQYEVAIFVSAPRVVSTPPQIRERNFQIVQLHSLDKSPPAPGRAPPVR